MIGFTHALATELGESGITVNALAPGLVCTGTTESGPQTQMFDMVVEMQATKRTENPDDVVGVLSFLASNDAAFMTGQTLVVDGGITRL